MVGIGKVFRDVETPLLKDRDQPSDTVYLRGLSTKFRDVEPIVFMVHAVFDMLHIRILAVLLVSTARGDTACGS